MIRAGEGKETKLTQRRKINRHKGGGCGGGGSPVLQMKVGLRVKSVAQAASAQRLSWDAGPGLMD